MISGGDFGIEASIISVTVYLLFAILAFAFVYSVWNDEKGDSITSIGKAQVSKIVEDKLSYMFRFNGSLNHIYFDLEELKEFSGTKGANQISINLATNAIELFLFTA